MSKSKETRDLSEQDRTLIININLTRGLLAWSTVAVLVVVFLGYLIGGGQETAAADVQAVSASSTGMREYYLAKGGYTGAMALTACAPGFHMASLWEILDPSNLAYNTEYGYIKADSGNGPPTYRDGWVRTGFAADTTNTQGRGNCNAWTSSSSEYYGTLAWLPDEWDPSTAEIHTWVAGWSDCSAGQQVWCVED